MTGSPQRRCAAAMAVPIIPAPKIAVGENMMKTILRFRADDARVVKVIFLRPASGAANVAILR